MDWEDFEPWVIRFAIFVERLPNAFVYLCWLGAIMHFQYIFTKWPHYMQNDGQFWLSLIAGLLLLYVARKARQAIDNI